MPTEKQLQASRKNGALSRGPITPEGKFHSAHNATRHGLLAGTVVLEEESEDRFQALLSAFMEEYQPATQTQITLVETMAVARWRQLRVWGAQKTALDRDMALQDPAVGPPPVRALFALRGSADSACPLELLLRYDIAFDHQFIRALSRLLVLKAKPISSQAAPYFPAAPAGQTWKPSPSSNKEDPPNKPPLPNEPKK
jgi:hypothetical protein